MPPSAALVVASWQRDAVHIWGWDGVQTMAPFWLSIGFPSSGRVGPPARHGFHSSLDVVAPSGERLRPVSVRLDAVAGLDWLQAVPVESDSVRWFGVLAKLAERVIEAGAVVPVITTGSGPVPADVPNVVAEMHWSPATGSTVDAYLDSLAESMPPICLADVAHDDQVTRRHVVGTIFESFVDNTARARLQRAGWEPIVPKNRSAATALRPPRVPGPHRAGPPRPDHSGRPRRRPRPGRRDPPPSCPPGSRRAGAGSAAAPRRPRRPFRPVASRSRARRRVGSRPLVQRRRRVGRQPPRRRGRHRSPTPPAPRIDVCASWRRSPRHASTCSPRSARSISPPQSSSTSRRRTTSSSRPLRRSSARASS